jgi:hypothetical protein
MPVHKHNARLYHKSLFARIQLCGTHARCRLNIVRRGCAATTECRCCCISDSAVTPRHFRRCPGRRASSLLGLLGLFHRTRYRITLYKAPTRSLLQIRSAPKGSAPRLASGSERRQAKTRTDVGLKAVFITRTSVSTESALRCTTLSYYKQRLRFLM